MSSGCTGSLSGLDMDGGDRPPPADDGGTAAADAGPMAARDAMVPPGVDGGPPAGVDAGPAPADAGPACAAGQTSCGGACVDTDTDPAHCGRCGQACAPGGSCAGGACMGGVGCPPAPTGVDVEAAAALDLTNEARTAMGVPCMGMSPEINLAAERHCNYYAANRGDPMCTANAHGEVMGCMLFVAERFDARMREAGYRGTPIAENMHFIANGRGAVQGWIDSVYHRNPVLRPWVGEMGYGRDTGCDTADYGGGSGASTDLTVTYPYPAQADVPPSFNGREGPTPPAPPSGYPSGYPITIYTLGELTEHRLTIDGSDADVPHVWLYPGHPETSSLLRQEYVMYAHEPLQRATTYRVRASGTTRSGAPLSVDYTFTTR